MLSQAMANLAMREISQFGSPTQANGVILNAVWARAQPNRVQNFENDTTWSQAGYEVKFPPTALNAPCSLAVGDTVVNLNSNYSGVVRDLDIYDLQGTVMFVVAIVEIMSE